MKRPNALLCPVGYCLLLLIQFLLVGSSVTRDLLHRDILTQDYNRYTQPVHNESVALEVLVTADLMQILNLDEAHQVLTTLLWITTKYVDYRLAWDPEKYDNVTDMYLPQKSLWKPDLYIINTAEGDGHVFGSNEEDLAIVQNTGLVYSQMGKQVATFCSLDLTRFPFDQQNCCIRMMSNVVRDSLVNLTTVPHGFSMEKFFTSIEWEVLDTKAEEQFDLWDNPFSTLETEKLHWKELRFCIRIRRAMSFFTIAMCLPCIILCALSLLVFLMPPGSGEKMSVGMTCWTALVVFLLILVRTVPGTGSQVPLIVLYAPCGCITMVTTARDHPRGSTSFASNSAASLVCKFQTETQCDARAVFPPPTSAGRPRGSKDLLTAQRNP